MNVKSGAMRFRLSLALAAASLLVTQPTSAQRGGGATDAQIVGQAERVASGTRVELFQHGLTVDPALFMAAERALDRMETALGRKLDEPTLGPKIRIYVSASVAVSHVWRNYDHPRDPRPILFLNPRVARGALIGADATYAHEMAHLLTWRYHSHTLREGLADYLALQVHPGAGIGPNSQGYGSPPAVPAGLAKYLGTTRPPPRAVNDDVEFRRAYYYASYCFVRLLIERGGMLVFLQIYDARNPEPLYPKLYGARRSELVGAALQTPGRSPAGALDSRSRTGINYTASRGLAKPMEMAIEPFQGNRARNACVSSTVAD